MTLDDEIKLQFEQCTTISELKAAVRRVLTAHGKDERLLKPVLLSFFGGHVVRVDSQGVPLNPWRRKFFPQATAQSKPQREAA